MRARLARHWYSIAVVALLFGIVAVGSFLVTVAGPDVAALALRAPTQTTSPTPSPSPLSPMAMSPIGISMPPGADCNGCHTTETGAIATKAIPVMGHPLFGWRDCTACHTTGSLVASAPGHSGLHKDDCLVCHQTRTEAGDDSPAPLRPEHMGTDKPCVACHGVDDHAPLPESMAGRDNCWICHNGKEFTYLFEESPSPEPAPTRDTTGTQGSTAAPDSIGYRLAGDAIR